MGSRCSCHSWSGSPVSRHSRRPAPDDRASKARAEGREITGRVQGVREGTTDSAREAPASEELLKSSSEGARRQGLWVGFPGRIRSRDAGRALPWGTHQGRLKGLKKALEGLGVTRAEFPLPALGMEGGQQEEEAWGTRALGEGSDLTLSCSCTTESFVTLGNVLEFICKMGMMQTSLR